MKIRTLCMTVGRGSPQPLVSVAADNPDADTVLAQRQAFALLDQIRSGVAPSRVVFEEQSHDAEDEKPEDKPKTRKGR